MVLLQFRYYDNLEKQILYLMFVIREQTIILDRSNNSNSAIEKHDAKSYMYVILLLVKMRIVGV